MPYEFVRVFVFDIPFGIDDTYEYFVPPQLRDNISRGTFVTVPFGNSNRGHTAVVFELIEKASYPKAKPIIEICQSQIRMSEEMFGICSFLKEQTLCTYSEAIRAMIPSGALSKPLEFYTLSQNVAENKLRKYDTQTLFVIDYIRSEGTLSSEKLKARFGEHVSGTLKELCADGVILRSYESKEFKFGKEKSYYSLSVTVDEANTLLSVTKGKEKKLNSEKQRDIIRALIKEGNLSDDDLCKKAGVTKQQLKPLLERGLISKNTDTIYRDPYAKTTFREPVKISLNAEQNDAFTELCSLADSQKPQAALLHGVTGSGKTCVMMALIDKILTDGKGAIVLLPEISLTPQSLDIFRAQYGKRVAVIHSGLSAGERLDTFLRIYNGEADVVVGTRSAVFAPLKNLGVIIIDEEQEHTYKSDSSPKYHARDIARYRCAHNNALMLLCSATPSIESYQKAKKGIYKLIQLKKRYGKSILPEVTVADMRDEIRSGNLTPMGNILSHALTNTISEKNQAILFLNRRGYNNYISCRSCGTAVLCPNCSVAMTYHTTNKTFDDGELVCHWCGYKSAIPKVCPTCSSEHITRMGYGTQRIEQELQLLLPNATTLRMDTDTTSTKFSYDRMLAQFREHKADILLGTQMVTKGHDFPDVTLVGVLFADASLYLDDYRANERTFSMITQVIGRAGRSDKPGRAIIQTNIPDNDIIKLAREQDYEGFFEREIKLRRFLVFPPFCDIVLMTMTAKDEKELFLVCNQLSDEFKLMTSNEYKDVAVIAFGPFEAPVYRVNGKYRMRMVIKCVLNKRSRSLFAALLKKFSSLGTNKPLLSVDFNPSNL